VLVSPFRVFGIAARPRLLPAEVRPLLELVARSELRPVKVSPLLALRSRSAVSTLPRLCGFPLMSGDRRLLHCRFHSLFELHPPFRVFTQQNLLSPDVRPSPLMGFCSLQHVWRDLGPLFAGQPTRSVSASGFDHPLADLLPRNPCQFYFTPAALLGFFPSKVHVPVKVYGVHRADRTHLSLA
jgi:hypothetical protein